MSEEERRHCAVTHIEVRLQIGESLLAASDDPLFLGITGACGREFRLALARGRSLRRGAEDVYVLGAPKEASTNVRHAELNDPCSPPLDAAQIQGVYLRKGNDPIPNVRGVGELDDRLEVAHISVAIHSEGSPSIHFARRGPLWLGMASGTRFDLARLPGAP